jgi:hypothetical protein
MRQVVHPLVSQIIHIAKFQRQKVRTRDSVNRRHWPCASVQSSVVVAAAAAAVVVTARRLHRIVLARAVLRQERADGLRA